MAGIARCVALAAALLMHAVASAQDFSGKTISLVVPFAPGAVSDSLARMVAPKLGEVLGANVIVENKSGANTNLGTVHVARSQPDGRTLLLAGTALVVNGSMYKDKLPFDPVNDFAPISLVATTHSTLVVHPSLQVDTVRQLIALAKSKPGELNYASAGSGNMMHLAMELIQLKTGTSIIHVPYKGAGPAVNDVLAGHVKIVFVSPGAIEAHVKAGKLKALAIAGSKRVDMLPDVPTFTEVGLPMPEVDFGTWFGLLAPAGTPGDIIAKLHQAVAQALADPDIQRRLKSAGFEPKTNTPAEYRAMVQDHIKMWRPVIEQAKITVD